MKLKLPCFALAASLGSALPLASQTAAPAEPRKSEEIVSLSEFTVSAVENRGYVASETMTGSRINTKIAELPYSIVNLTSEFFEDFGILELNESVTYIAGFTNLGIGGGFNLRGFSSTSQLRDGFYRLGRYGQSNVDRLEIIRGPNAAIYGRSSPGGMVNMISKQPRPTEMQSLTLTTGSFGTRRARLEATGLLRRAQQSKTYYVATLGTYERDYPGEFSHLRNTELYGAVKHDFANGAHFMATAEYFLQVQHSPAVAPPLVIDNRGTATAADNVAIGYARNLARTSPYGGNSELNRGSATFTATYDQRLNSVLSLRAAAQYFRARRWDYNVNTGWGGITINNPGSTAIATARGAQPNKNLIMEDGGGTQADLLAHYRLGDGTVDNKTLVTIDFNDYYRWDPTYNLFPANHPEILAWNAVRTVQLNPDYTPIGTVGYFPRQFQWGQENQTGHRRIRTSSLGSNFKHQSFWFNNRLITYAGVRFDMVRFRSVDKFVAFPSYGFPAGSPAGMVRRSVKQTKPNLGFNFAATPALRLYGSYSESYFVDQTVRPNIVGDPFFAPETARGYDYGIKGAFLEDRLNFTLGGFYVNRYNVAVSEFVEDPPGSGSYVTLTRYEGNQLVRGWESDISWRASDALTVGSSLGGVHSIYTDYGSAFPASIGRKVNGVSPMNGSVYAKYSIERGALRGLAFNLMCTYVSSTPSELPNAGDTYGTVNGVRVVTSSTQQWNLRVPSSTLWNAGVHYRLPARKGYQHQFSLNLNNVFDLDFLKTNRTLGDGRSILFTYTLTRRPAAR